MIIPYLSTPDAPIVSTTQDFVPIADITEDIVIYKNGAAALIMESSSLNFGLLSEEEQVAVIASYAGLLNSFNFPVQTVVRSQVKDISSFMQFLNQAEKNIKNPKLSALMKNYKNFITESIKKKNVLSKKFYIVIPFTPYQLGVGKSFAASFKPGKAGSLPFPKSFVIRKAKISLLPKRDHLMRQVGRIGIKLRPLKTAELIQLFYNIYNPESQVPPNQNLE